MKKKKIRIKGRDICRYLMLIALGYLVFLIFPWDLVWILFERIFQVSLEIEKYRWGNFLFQFTMISFLAVIMKWDMRQEAFYEKGRIDLKRKILILFVLFVLDDMIPEIIGKICKDSGKMGEGYDNSLFILDSISAFHILLLVYILVCALTEELLCRYITCNCLKKLHLHNGIILFLQALIFTIIHRYEIMGSVNVFMGGFVYGIILYLTRTPFCGWMLHSAYNLKVMTDGPLENWWLSIAFFVSVIYVIGSERLYKKQLQRKKKRKNSYRKQKMNCDKE